MTLQEFLDAIQKEINKGELDPKATIVFATDCSNTELEWLSVYHVNKRKICFDIGNE